MKTTGIIFPRVVCSSLLLWMITADGFGAARFVTAPGMGVTESVAAIMEREARTPAASSGAVREPKPRLSPNEGERPERPWPPWEVHGRLPGPFAAEPAALGLGTSFLGAQVSESGFVPPDSMGDVGPTQILVCVNGRIKVFDKFGNLGGLNATTDNFFASLLAAHASTTDPRVRYDRLSGRWFVIMIDIPPSKKNNHVLIAVSSGATITSSSSFTFFAFQQNTVSPAGDDNFFADYPTLGVDNNALYIGANMFSGNSFAGTTGFVVNKAQLLVGTVSVTAFRQLAAPGGAGPASPYGVDNDDPSATEGYFVGVDNSMHSRLVLRRVSNPGGSPTISGNILLTVPTTVDPIVSVPALGTSTGLDALDDRLFAARMHKGSLWTAHNIQVDSTGAASSSGGRNGSRWYEINNLTGTPTLRQSGTLFDSAASNPAFYWIPSCTMSGQGHMYLGCSVAGVNQHAEIAVAMRHTNDSLGSIQAPMIVQTSSTSYNVNDASNPHRWGDFSVTSVDPNDDMTIWTFQEYCNGTDSWGLRVIQIKAPPPATPASASPPSVSRGAANVNVVVTGTSISGSGFFDPGSAYPNRISATVDGGGVTVNSVTYTDPTHITLNISVQLSATPGARTITVTNPDSQVATSSSGILTILNANPVAGSDTVLRLSNQSVKVAATTLLSNDTDAENDPLTLTSVMYSGSGTVTFDGAYVFYFPPMSDPASEMFTYSINDGHGGSATGTVTVNIAPPDNSQSKNIDQVFTDGMGMVHVIFSGIPGRTYTVQWAPSLPTASWTTIGSVMVGATGQGELIYMPPPLETVFFRTISP